MATAEKIIPVYLSLAIISLLILLAGGWYDSTPRFLGSLGCGILIGGVNFVLLVWIIENLTSGERVNKKKLVVSFVGKGLLLGVIIILILGKGHVSPLPFLLGLSNVFLGILAYGIRGWVRSG